MRIGRKTGGWGRGMGPAFAAGAALCAVAFVPEVAHA